MDNIYRFIREPECRRITGLSRTTRWRMEKVGTFPKPYKLSPNISAYKSSEIQRWIDERRPEDQS